MTDGEKDASNEAWPKAPPLPLRRQPEERPRLTDVGILRLCVYVPHTAVSQADLENWDGASRGKYTIGLGQSHMSFVTDREDVISLALTALSSLVRDAEISYSEIGRLDVGTETILDKSKSIKSSLMQLFVREGNSEVEGLDSTNACYGSTEALFNAAAWVESSAWDGRYAVVVATDVAVYAKGPARPTGGAAAVAMLVGRDAPIRFERGLRATEMGHSYDFFKPRVNVEYPTVRGQLSIDTYVHALDACYTRYARRAGDADARRFDVRDGADFWVFHAPFHKLVRKSFARLMYKDFEASERGMDERFRDVEQFRGVDGRNVHRNKEVVAAFMKLSSRLFDAKCMDAAWLGCEIGNCYTASLYSSLSALVQEVGDGLVGKRIVLYGFGSGFAASMFSLRVTGAVRGIVVGMPLRRRLEMRTVVTGAVFEEVMKKRERDYGRFGYQPSSDVDELFPGTFYLKEVDEDGEREYEQVPWETEIACEELADEMDEREE